MTCDCAVEVVHPPFSPQPRSPRCKQRVAALEAALRDMTGLAESGAARAHLDQAGILQDPPHSWGIYAECEAPWCVRNQERVAAARSLLTSHAAAEGD